MRDESGETRDESGEMSVECDFGKFSRQYSTLDFSLSTLNLS